eukprot:194224_1
MTTTSKESAFLKKIKRKSSLLAIQYALPDYKNHPEEYVGLLKLALIDKGKMLELLDEHENTPISMSDIIPKIQDYDKKKIKITKRNNKLLQNIHLFSIKKPSSNTRTGTSKPQRKHPRRQPSWPLSMTLRSSHKTDTQSIHSPSSNPSPNSQYIDPGDQPLVSASRDIPQMNSSQDLHHINPPITPLSRMNSSPDLHHVDPPITAAAHDMNEVTNACLIPSPHHSPFAAATPDMNDTQSTTNNSLRDPNNNGIAAPMDIDQDDDTDDEDQCMSNDIPIEQQNRWAAYENEPWYQKVKQKEAAKQAKKTSKTPISETDNKLEILLR